MCATYRDTQDLLTDASLKRPRLDALTPNIDPYDLLLIQTAGQVAASGGGVGHDDHAGAVARFSSFLQLATERQVDLAVTPEYSCPWEALLGAFAQNRFPAMGKLWAIACESITPAGLEATKLQHPEVTWLHEPVPAGQGNFLDVLVYLTRAEHNDGSIRKVAVLQFKTTPMGGIDFEQQNLRRGTTTYYWCNHPDNIRLMTLLCSESLTFDQAASDACRFDLHPYLLLHPQLTDKPRHPNSAAYRARLFAANGSDDVEIITLNWARGFVIPGSPPSECGNSAIFTKAPQFNLSDAWLEENHRKGLFYSHWPAQRTQQCILAYDEHIFHLRTYRVGQVANAAQAYRPGPQMVELWSWDPALRSWTPAAQCDDGFAALCSSYNQPQCKFFTTAPVTALDRERLLVLTAGKLLRSERWHEVGNLPPFHAEADERTKRLTFTHEQAAASKDYRAEFLRAMVRLQLTVLPNAALFPPTISDLIGKWEMMPPAGNDGYLTNLKGVAQGAAKPAAAATVIFLGMVPEVEARKLRHDLEHAWPKTTQKPPRRLVIWYEFGNDIHFTFVPEFDITGGSDAPATITSEDNS
jgi:hypothetical protein